MYTHIGTTDGVMEHKGGFDDQWVKLWVFSRHRPVGTILPSIGMDRQGWYYLIVGSAAANPIRPDTHHGPFESYEAALATFNLMFS